jgi:glycosyltransferase involved in cell wall biosynthesis
MRILHISETDIGGASKAANRIHHALIKQGVHSIRFVRRKFSSDPTILTHSGLYTRLKTAIITRISSSVTNFIYPNRKKNAFSNSIFTAMKIPRKLVEHSDIIHLHWLGLTSLNFSDIPKFNKPIVWRLPDMFPFTGGCHYSGGCERYINECSICPFLDSHRRYDLAYFNYRKKLKAIQQIKNLVVSAPSSWLTACALKSKVFEGKNVLKVPTGVNLELLTPLDKRVARNILGLKSYSDCKIISYGAATPRITRKGYDLFCSSLKYLAEKFDDNINMYKLLILGKLDKPLDNTFGIETITIGHLFDEVSLKIFYSAADVFVAPSIEENLPNTAIEALACGTPVVGFNVGGMPDIIVDKLNGRIAKSIEPQALAECTQWVLEDANRHLNLCKEARKFAEKNFDLTRQVSDYMMIYEKLLLQA